MTKAKFHLRPKGTQKGSKLLFFFFLLKSRSSSYTLIKPKMEKESVETLTQFLLS